MNKSALIGTVCLFVCALTIWESARIGFARTCAIKALTSNGAGYAEKSVRKLPNDAEVHAARGIVLQRTEDYAEGCRELERAVQLRPRDYFLWMMLGITRDLNGDQQGALTALRESVTLAPTYAKPRWLIGNLLLRMNQTDEGFQQLRAAAEADSSLLPNVIDLAWGFSRNDPAMTAAFVGPQSTEAHMSLAIFLAQHKEGSAALDQFRLIKPPAGTASDQLAQQLIESKSFGEAFEVWSNTHCASCRPGSLVNGDFESDIAMSKQGFGWQITNPSPNVTLSIDTAEHEEGARSLRIDFQGESDSARPLISEFVVVNPATRYRLSFQALTRAFVSAGVPVVEVMDASSSGGSVLGKSSHLTGTTWHDYSVDFTTSANTHAIQLILTRAGCPANACSAFGTIWLDSFALEVTSSGNER